MFNSEMTITSAKNPHVKGACDLRDRRQRDRSKLFLIEGYRELRRYLDAGAKGKQLAPLSKLFCSTECFLGTGEEALIHLAKEQGAQILRTSRRVFERLSYRDRPDGLLGIAPQHPLDLLDLHLRPLPLVAIAEGIEKPGNLGTLLRCGDAAGIDALIVSQGQTDLWNPNTVRASIGTLFSVPVAESSNEALHQWLGENGLRTIAATPDGSMELTRCDFRSPCAVLLGSEQFGLSRFWRERADCKVAIPMKGSADSLNIAIAGALIFYEALRQRSEGRA